MYGLRFQSMTLELNASDDRGIGVVRDQIKSFAGTKQLFNTGVKLVILDEADSMTNDAQFALRRIIEKNTKNTRFCMICNYVNKIIPALQSRCTRFRFGPLQPEQVRGRMEFIIAEEGLDVTEDGKDALLDLSCGDMRRVLNVMQAASMSFTTIDETAVYTCTGNPLPSDIQAISEHLFNSPFQTAYQATRELCVGKGYAMMDIIKDLTEILVTMELPALALANMLDEMSSIEHRLAAGASEKLQLGALVGVFMVAREAITPEE
mmetsp:Transcript_18793/g.43732  ORF Transcript_18793/g.43732 Transcript_18793/m.43732 type:complete len:264 (-) Transcript_18793:295-1086(-)